MSRIVLVLLVILAVFSVGSSPQQQCSENQEWTTCGTACPPMCNTTNPEDCTLQCVTGCQCKNGYLLNSRGRCVSPENC